MAPDARGHRASLVDRRPRLPGRRLGARRAHGQGMRRTSTSPRRSTRLHRTSHSRRRATAVPDGQALRDRRVQARRARRSRSPPSAPRRYHPGSRRPSVEFLPDLEQDLGRRDFTINAMALHGDELIDLFGGRADLEPGCVRAVGDPAERFSEDPLRMLRAARFVSQLDFDIEGGTREAMSLPRPQHPLGRARAMDDRTRPAARRPGRRASAAPGCRHGPAALPAARDRAADRHRRHLLGRAWPLPLRPDTVDAVGSAPAEVTSAGPRCCSMSPRPTFPAEQGEDRETARALLGAEIVERTALYLKWSNRRRESVKRLVVGAGGPGEDMTER